MKFTKHARAELDSLPDDRRAQVGNYAKRLAMDDNSRSVCKRHVIGALLLADERFFEDTDDDSAAD